MGAKEEGVREDEGLFGLGVATEMRVCYPKEANGFVLGAAGEGVTLK